LDEDGKDRVVGMICVEDGSQDTVLVISEKGYGKRTLLDDENGEPIYRITNRGGKGVKTMNVTEKTGNLIGMEAVNDDQDLMLITKSGTAIRMAMNAISVLGRATQGVKLIELQKRNDTLMFGCTVPKEETEEVAENAEAITDNVSTVEE
jgi:DNA gyrase subunit A